MSDWFYPATETELARINEALVQFRDHWTAYATLFPASFTGELPDIHALDYLDYEGLEYPSSGVEGAALVWGEVLRKLFDLRWVISYRNDYMLATQVDDIQSVLLFVFPRIMEVQYRVYPQFQKYHTAFEDALLRYGSYDLTRRILGLIASDPHRSFDRLSISPEVKALFEMHPDLSPQTPSQAQKKSRKK